jgi:hypothetical protein
MNPNKPEELVPPEKRELMLAQMNQLIEAFYWRAFAIGCHPFIEFCGVMGEYLKVAQAAHAAGIDFTNTTAHSGFPLPIQPYNASYLGEKIGCIYGPALQDPENRRAFLEALGIGDKTEPWATKERIKVDVSAGKPFR